MELFFSSFSLEIFWQFCSYTTCKHIYQLFLQENCDQAQFLPWKWLGNSTCNKSGQLPLALWNYFLFPIVMGFVKNQMTYMEPCLVKSSLRSDTIWLIFLVILRSRNPCTWPSPVLHHFACPQVCLLAQALAPNHSQWYRSPRKWIGLEWI